MTEDEQAEITMAMRVIEVMRKHADATKEVPELVEQAAIISETVRQLFKTATPEQRDQLLERYREEMEWLEKNP